MKIINKGQAWWHGKQGECFDCKTKVEFNEETMLSKNFIYATRNDLSYFCPVCMAEQRLHRPILDEQTTKQP